MSIIRNKALAFSARLAAPAPARVGAGRPPAAGFDPEPPPLSLDALRRGQVAQVVALAGESGLRHRLQALGLRPGQRLQVLRRAPWGGPIHLQVGMTELMLRRRDAACIAVTPAPSLR